MRLWLQVSGCLLVAVFLAAGCDSTQNTIQGNTGAALSFLAPADATAGGVDFTLNVNGAGFASNSVVRWNGQNRTTTFVNTNQVTVIIKAADIANPGTVLVTAFTPQSGSGLNGLSNTLTFTILPPPNPVPAIASMAPDHVAAGGMADVPLVIMGSNFMPPTNPAQPSTGSVVHWNPTVGGGQSTLVTTSITATQISATVPAALVAAQGAAIVTVFNPAPGGGTSPNGPTFTIDPVPPGILAAGDSPAISQDGRYVAFVSSSGGHSQVYARDTCTGAEKSCETKTTLISVNSSGDSAQGDSRAPAMSADGRYLAFESDAKDLAASVPAGRQVFLRDTCAGAGADCQPATTLVSADSGGALSGNENGSPAISASGRFVAFVSVTPARGGKNSPGQTNSGFRQVFVRDTCLGATDCTPRTVRISLHPGDAAAPGGAAKPAMSGNGERVAVPAPIANIFTPSVAVDDRVFVALTASPK